jgi:hypothetical protein
MQLPHKSTCPDFPRIRPCTVTTISDDVTTISDDVSTPVYRKGTLNSYLSFGSLTTQLQMSHVTSMTSTLFLMLPFSASDAACVDCRRVWFPDTSGR